jgi:hypothetical protein
MQIACMAHLDTFCTLELTKCGRRAFESGVGHTNQIYFYPIFPCRSIYSRVYHSILIFPWCTREYKK